MLYSPAEYFEGSQDALCGSIKDRHPYEAAYILVPKKEAEDIYSNYKQRQSEIDEPGWCILECQRVPDPEVLSGRKYVCNPLPCDVCTGANACYTLAVTIDTELELRTRSSVPIAAGRQVSGVEGNTTGVELKDRILAEFELEGVVPGQLLLSINGSSFGDTDSLRQVLGVHSFIQEALLTVEIYDFVMSEPAPKRHRSSLLDSNLVGSKSG